MGIALHAQSLYPDFSKLNFGCDGNSITAGEQWSKTVVDKLGFATHHNVAVGSGGWQVTEDKHELQMRHNNVSKVHIQKFIAEVESGVYPAPDVFVFSMGTNDRNLGSAEEALKGKTLDEVDVNTMAGGARWSIQTILEHYPQCRVFVCTPIQTGNPEHNALNLQKIAILRELCTEKFEQPSGSGRYLRDGLHPDKPGQELMGRYIAKEIRNHFF